jgi:hypothetical protein
VGIFLRLMRETTTAFASTIAAHGGMPRTDAGKDAVAREAVAKLSPSARQLLVDNLRA